MGNNEGTLRPVRTKEEARERGRAGGIASGIARRARAKERQEWQELFKLALRNGDKEKIKSLSDAKGKNMAISKAMKVKLVTEALKGNLKAYELIMHYAGLDEPDSAETAAEQTNQSFMDALNEKASEVWEDEKQEE